MCMSCAEIAVASVPVVGFVAGWIAAKKSARLHETAPKKNTRDDGNPLKKQEHHDEN